MATFDVDRRYVGKLGNRGRDGIVYRISREFVVKLPPRIETASDVDDFEEEKLRKDESVGRELYQAGFPVPFPIGIREIDLNQIGDFAARTARGYVMEYVPGKYAGEYVPPRWALNMARKEIERAESVGFKPGRDAEHNFIWRPKKEGVVLIDFALWEDRVESFV